ncbi:hypothetical protein [Mesorhizobium salmacidum]|uniref:Uncharacterized protein n=1 Tax=Mesorhizobium salmacidum TaxID=3015171 RepID=A0ABU8L3F7_9HYPH
MNSKYRSGESTAWLKTKAYAIDEFDLLGVECQAGKPAFALMADRETGRYVGSAFIKPGRGIRERLWQRVQEHAGPAPKGMNRPATQWSSRASSAASGTYGAMRIFAMCRCRILGKGIEASGTRAAKRGPAPAGH